MFTDRPRGRTALRRSVRRAAAASAAVATAAAMLVIAPATVANADPASPTTLPKITSGDFNGTVPDGVCAVQIEALGAAGGSSISTQNNSNGAGALITATYPVVPGATYSGTVGAGGGEGGNANGTMGVGGPPGGGSGGVSNGYSGFYHHGAGGGGYTTVSIGGTEAIVAGGGGGSGGGHTPNGTTYGFGGNAGLPTAAGVAAGQNGFNGFDGTSGQGGGGTVNGGQGGQTGAAGSGGTHSTSSAQNGFAGSGRTGGNGGDDPGADSGAGGGGGVYAGGGGASTVLSNQQNNSSGVSGAGGGGGASYVAAAVDGGAVSGISSEAGAKRNGNGAGAGGSVELTWVQCDYDLAVEKSVLGPDQDTGLTSWTVKVTNNGDDDMAIGDTVTLTDTLPGPDNTSITSINSPDGVTCKSGGTALSVGDPMVSPIECARVDGSGLADGESITIVYTQTLTKASDYVNTAEVHDRSGATANNADTAETEVTGPSTDNGTTEGRRGKEQRWTPTPTRGTFDVDCADTLTLLDGDGDPVEELAVPNVGTYSVDNCEIVFNPELTYDGTPPPVDYQVSDSQGNPATGTYTPTVLPAAPPSTNPGTTSGPQGVAQSWEPSPVAGEDFDIDWSTLTLLDGGGDPTDEVVVSGQGTYTVVGQDLVFTPLPTFVGEADPVDYRISDEGGQDATSTYTPTLTAVTPQASVDSSTGRPNQPQSTDPLINDQPGHPDVPLDPGSLTLLDDGDPVEEVTVPEGVYTIDRTDPDKPLIVFTPNTNYHGSVTAVDYQIADTNGTTDTATYTPDVVAAPPSTNPGTTSGPQGVAQSWEPSPVAGEDFDIDWSTLTLLDGGGDPTDEVVVSGQGTYTVVGQDLVFTPLPTFVGEADPVDYRISDEGGQDATSTYTPTLTAVTPEAGDDESSGWWNRSQSTDPLINDQPGHPDVPLDPGSLTLLDDGDPVDEVTVPEGVYTIDRTDPDKPLIVFTPKRGFTGAPTPVDYQIADTNGTTATATYRPTVRGPETSQDLVDTLVCGTPVVFDMVEEVPGLDPSTVQLVDAEGQTALEVKIEGQGTWTLDQSTGKATFTPDGCFVGRVNPVKWEGDLSDGTAVAGTLNITYVEAPVKDKPESGSSLPDTGGPAIGWGMAGLALVAAGWVLSRRRRGQEAAHRS